MKFTFIIFVFFITSLIASNFASAQINSNDQPYVVESKSSGEISSWKTDTMRSEMNGERLFIIVRLGKGETNHQINQIRLAKTKWFMLNKGFNQQTSVFAEGERVEGEGTD